MTVLPPEKVIPLMSALDKVVLTLLLLLIGWCTITSIQLYRRPPVEAVTRLIATEGMTRSEIVASIGTIQTMVTDAQKQRDNLLVELEVLHEEMAAAAVVRQDIREQLKGVSESLQENRRILSEIKNLHNGPE